MRLKWRRCVAVLALIAGAALLAQLPVGGSAARVVLAGDDLLRLHVIANSDSDRDQELKLQVRDRLLELLVSELPPGAGQEATREYFVKNRDRLQDAAEAVLVSNGSLDEVHITVGEYWFPEKTSGAVIVPAGLYQAVRIVIGEGNGHNWWCVLFPQLCLAGEEVTPEEALELVTRAGLAPGEPFVDEESLTQTRYEVRLKLLDWARSTFAEPPHWLVWLSRLR